MAKLGCSYLGTMQLKNYAAGQWVAGTRVNGNWRMANGRALPMHHLPFAIHQARVDHA